MNICIYGAASDSIDASYKKGAWELGAEIGRAGYGIVFGAGATGLMGAAARGFQSASPEGELIGIAPRFFDRPGILYEDCSRMIYTDTVRERKQLMEDASDVFMALPGGIGTFEEFFEILTLKQLRQHDKHVILYNMNGYYDHILAQLKHAVDEEFLYNLDLCDFISSPEELFQLLR